MLQFRAALLGAALRSPSETFPAHHVCSNCGHCVEETLVKSLVTYWCREGKSRPAACRRWRKKSKRRSFRGKRTRLTVWVKLKLALANWVAGLRRIPKWKRTRRRRRKTRRPKRRWTIRFLGFGQLFVLTADHVTRAAAEPARQQRNWRKWRRKLQRRHATEVLVEKYCMANLFKSHEIEVHASPRPKDKKAKKEAKLLEIERAMQEMRSCAMHGVDWYSAEMLGMGLVQKDPAQFAQRFKQYFRIFPSIQTVNVGSRIGSYKFRIISA